MGMSRQFPLELDETIEKIKEYKRKVDDGTFKKADFWHFCGEIGVDAQDVVDVIKNPNDKNKPLAYELKKFVTWVQGQYLTASGWSGPNASKAIFALKQDLGGLVLTDRQEVKQDAKVEINVKFGSKSKDPFG